MIAFPLFLGGPRAPSEWADKRPTLAWLAGIPGLVLSWYAALLYVPLARQALRDGRDQTEPAPRVPSAS